MLPDDHGWIGAVRSEPGPDATGSTAERNSRHARKDAQCGRPRAIASDGRSAGYADAEQALEMTAGRPPTTRQSRLRPRKAKACPGGGSRPENARARRGGCLPGSERRARSERMLREDALARMLPIASGEDGSMASLISSLRVLPTQSHSVFRGSLRQRIIHSDRSSLGAAAPKLPISFSVVGRTHQAHNRKRKSSVLNSDFRKAALANRNRIS